MCTAALNTPVFLCLGVKVHRKFRNLLLRYPAIPCPLARQLLGSDFYGHPRSLIRCVWFPQLSVFFWAGTPTNPNLNLTLVTKGTAKIFSFLWHSVCTDNLCECMNLLCCENNRPVGAWNCIVWRSFQTSLFGVVGNIWMHMSIINLTNELNCGTVSFSAASPSVLWRCWLDGKKGIQPVKNWAMRFWRGYRSGARCRLAYGPADATATHCLLLQ